MVQVLVVRRVALETDGSAGAGASILAGEGLGSGPRGQPILGVWSRNRRRHAESDLLTRKVKMKKSSRSRTLVESSRGAGLSLKIRSKGQLHFDNR